MKGWWCVRYGNALACVEATSKAAAVRRSLDLHCLGDWTDDARKLDVFPQDAYPEHAGPHDYTRAVLNANPASRRRSSSRFPRQSRLALVCLVGVLALGFVHSTVAETWRGTTVAPGHRCAPYDKRRDYPYPQSVENDIVRTLGAVYGPYTGTCFSSTPETDIEHVVAATEAHDSGLCARDVEIKARFSRDLRMTVAVAHRKSICDSVAPMSIRAVAYERYRRQSVAARASQCSFPYTTTATPIPLLLAMNPGLAEQKRPWGRA